MGVCLLKPSASLFKKKKLTQNGIFVPTHSVQIGQRVRESNTPRPDIRNVFKDMNENVQRNVERKHFLP